MGQKNIDKTFIFLSSLTCMCTMSQKPARSMLVGTKAPPWSFAGKGNVSKTSIYDKEVILKFNCNA